MVKKLIIQKEQFKQTCIKVLNNVEKVIANSEYTKNLAIECGVNKDKIIVINPGVDPAEEVK